mgnify:CR=1 FL=1
MSIIRGKIEMRTQANTTQIKVDNLGNPILDQYGNIQT